MQRGGEVLSSGLAHVMHVHVHVMHVHAAGSRGYQLTLALGVVVT